MKTAVILFNLGGPDSKESIKPFLFNFFTDKNIIPLPYPLRWLIAKMISIRRSKREAGDSYGMLGHKSPLLKNSQEQASALEKALGESFKVFICMRYWHPMAPEVMREVQKWNLDKILLLPLYPQFSTTTTWSALGAWNKAAKECGLSKETSVICCYPFNEGFISASVANIKTQIEIARKDGHQNIRILFSAHGLPEDVIKKGDSYQWQCEETARKIFEKLGTPEIDWRICYQSKVGPKKWIGPALDESLQEAAKDNKAVIIYPHAFTQEHVETLVELDIEYKHKAEEYGIKGYYRAATVSTHPDFINGLARLVQTHKNKKNVSADGGAQICPAEFSRCCMNQYKIGKAA